MSRNFISFRIADPQQTKLQMLNWANRFNICSFLDSQQYNAEESFECLLAAGALHTLSTMAGNAFDQLHSFHTRHKDWLFGHLSYDLKNELEPVASSNPDNINFPDLFFFVPEVLVKLTGQEMIIGIHGAHARHEDIFREILEINPSNSPVTKSSIQIQNKISRDEYIQTIQQLLQHIHRGDCYEINFCQEFYSNNASIDPLTAYQALCKISPNPFAAFYKVDDKFLLCASPERYLKKSGSSVFSQPIKGTWQRDLQNVSTDARYKEQLYNSAKDRSENVMIVDLVRNDLSKICSEGTVTVDELFGIYSFPQVHQMISTISGKLRPGIHFLDAIKATFPMGSMTGAPKKRVMELVERYEKTKRGIFSGAVGYLTPEGDFDFNVVIRSILYNASRKYLSFQAGSGITFHSDPEKEYEECLLKATAIRQILR